MKCFIYKCVILVITALLSSTANAAPSSVMVEVAGLGIDNGSSFFDLPLTGSLMGGGKYKLLLVGRDADSDNLNQSVNNVTFALEISNGNIDRFEWLVVGDIDDSDWTNQVAGVDNFGQVSTDTFTGHSMPTQALIDAGFAAPLKLAVIYFTAGVAGSPLNLNLDTNPYESGYSTNNSHYGINGVSYNINQGQGLSYSASVIAPLKVLNLTESNDPFSPNGDRYKDTTTFSGSFNQIASWKLTIKNTAGYIVRSFSGRGSKVTIVWDGKNSKGNILPDGLYPYVLSGTDAAGSSASATNTVSIGKTGRVRRQGSR